MPLENHGKIREFDNQFPVGTLHFGLIPWHILRPNYCGSIDASVLQSSCSMHGARASGMITEIR